MCFFLEISYHGYSLSRTHTDFFLGSRRHISVLPANYTKNLLFTTPRNKAAAVLTVVVRKIGVIVVLIIMMPVVVVEKGLLTVLVVIVVVIVVLVIVVSKVLWVLGCVFGAWNKSAFLSSSWSVASHCVVPLCFFLWPALG